MPMYTGNVARVWVAVGTALTDCPPHESPRAALLHGLLSWMNGIKAHSEVRCRMRGTGIHLSSSRLILFQFSRGL
jgi:hypothetical protein